jgi:hypothetical protein
MEHSGPRVVGTMQYVHTLLQPVMIGSQAFKPSPRLTYSEYSMPIPSDLIAAVCFRVVKTESISAGISRMLRVPQFRVQGTSATNFITSVEPIPFPPAATYETRVYVEDSNVYKYGFITVHQDGNIVLSSEKNDLPIHFGTIEGERKFGVCMFEIRFQ